MTADTLSTGKSVMVVAVVLGCFAVLWPKIFYPMLFGGYSGIPEVQRPDHLRPDRPHHHGGPDMHPAFRDKARMMFHGEEALASRRHTIEKDLKPGPVPGMRPTMGGPGMHPQPHRAAQGGGGGAMGIMMPLYTVAIVIFFLYTIMKIVFKRTEDDLNERSSPNFNQAMQTAAYNSSTSINGMSAAEKRYQQQQNHIYATSLKQYQARMAAQAAKAAESATEDRPESAASAKVKTAPGSADEEDKPRSSSPPPPYSEVIAEEKAESVVNSKIEEEKTPEEDLAEKVVENLDDIVTPGCQDCEREVAEKIENAVEAKEEEEGVVNQEQEDRMKSETRSNESEDQQKPSNDEQKPEDNEPSELNSRVQELSDNIGKVLSTSDPRDDEISDLKQRLLETERAMAQIMAQIQIAPASNNIVISGSKTDDANSKSAKECEGNKN